MKRIVSLWLPHWPIERLRRADPAAAPSDEPLALVAAGAHGIRIAALNEAARGEGLAAGGALADARAMLPGLASRPAQPARDRRSLLQLARWCGRYAPALGADITPADDGGPVSDHGLWLDVTGVAHLFGGEAALLADIARRLAGFGLTARLAMADTYGAAHALARFATTPERPVYLAPAGGIQAALAPLPVAALRLSLAAVLTLRRLGLKRIGDLSPLPRDSLARRFRSAAAGGRVLARLDQALGRTSEPLAPLVPPAQFSTRLSFGEPLIAHEGVVAAVGRVVHELCAALADADAGARRVQLALYRADGTMARLAAGTSAPTREPAHILRLVDERIARLDAGFGIDVIVIEATHVEARGAEQIGLAQDAGMAAAAARRQQLIDRLSNRLGAAAVVRLAPATSHLPERTQRRIVALANPPAAAGAPWPRPAGLARPSLLLSPPEPISVTAEVPEGPPRRFAWRRVEHRVVKGEGPERLAPEWWRTGALMAAREEHTENVAPSRAVKRNRPRDYYRVEDDTGAAFLVFREGLYGAGGPAEAPAWFVHGLYG